VILGAWAERHAYIASPRRPQRAEREEIVIYPTLNNKHFTRFLVPQNFIEITIISNI
jgi:hypothetical protein